MAVAPGTGKTVRLAIIVTEAMTQSLARRNGIARALKLWPTRRGFNGHGAAALEAKGGPYQPVIAMAAVRRHGRGWEPGTAIALLSTQGRRPDLVRIGQAKLDLEFPQAKWLKRAYLARTLETL
ncbi:hypothetical protein KKB83_03325 [Patescibacteria group bacterium]|nr:hypothetical protein [Patescibacteria group bacterium]